MVWIDIIVALILLFSLIGGLKAGAVYGFFSLLILIIVILVTGAFYGYMASLLSFWPGEDWENFLGFLLTMVIASIIISLVLFIPRHFIGMAWKGGGFSSLLGGMFNLANSAIGLIVLVLLFQTYPVIPWLGDILAESIILTWLAGHLEFVRLLLPEAFRSTLPAY